MMQSYNTVSEKTRTIIRLHIEATPGPGAPAHTL